MGTLNNVLKFKYLKKLRTSINCRVTSCSPNPDGIGYGSNEPNTINL